MLLHLTNQYNYSQKHLQLSFIALLFDWHPKPPNKFASYSIDVIVQNMFEVTVGPQFDFSNPRMI